MHIRLPWMSRADRKRWQSARTLADLGHLTAAWLQGDIKSQPGYQPNQGPDEETTHLIPILARLNRAGFVTDCSQPGGDETADGVRWQQRAAVSGFVTDPELRRKLISLDGIAAVEGPGGRPVIVTTMDGEPVTALGQPLPAEDLRAQWAVLHGQALEELLGATRLTLVDPEWGNNDRLWRALADILKPARAR